ncbi:MAG: deoxyribodipyrimidine photo-lyase [Akkermansiaceae bacterium]|nr:deoxyribodipyrimidine photo-lyase [Akkermansiaceae bacterium]
MPSQPVIVWFRRDLRLQDNPALNEAIRRGSAVVPLYIHCPREQGAWKQGRASQWWLHHALCDLQAQLRQLGLKLVIRSSTNSLDSLRELIRETGAASVFWNRCYEPSIARRDGQIQQELDAQGVRTESFNGSLLLDPQEITNKSGKPFQVFTPFWKHCRALTPARPETLPIAASPTLDPSPESIESLGLLPAIAWDKGIDAFWTPTRRGGIDLLEQAAAKSARYDTQRDIPAVDGTSRLSPYLHFGQISPREFFHAVRKGSNHQENADLGMLRQLYWREFSAHLLYHFPHSQDAALKPEYDLFPWQFHTDHLRAWQRGLTGFPIVDAGMRQLWHTGWMHNRVRMIAGSLLVKHLLQPWQEGARWFWDTLVDADLANNSMGWQWLAGSGADASPYFRIFNPVIQGKKFDPTGDYVRKWIPELAKMPDAHIHTPWDAPPLELAAADVTLGKDYPHPLISHSDGRQRALDAYAQYKLQIANSK